VLFACQKRVARSHWCRQDFAPGGAPRARSQNQAEITEISKLT